MHDGKQNCQYQKILKNRTNIYSNRLTDSPKLDKGNIRTDNQQTLKDSKLWWNEPGQRILKKALKMKSHEACLRTEAKEKEQQMFNWE
jgi:hypothetical protein